MSTQSQWKSKEITENYRKRIDFLVPGRRKILEILANLATLKAHDGWKILDIGAGHGDVTAEILKLCPHAHCTLIDFSPAMLDSSRERFKDNPNIDIVAYDLNDGLPAEMQQQKFDAAVSCFSLHHIEYANRVKLYRNIRDAIADDSCFANGDMFRCESPQLNDWEFNGWMHWMVTAFKEHLNEEVSFEEMKRRQLESFEKMGDKPGTVWEMEHDMREAGFRHVDCMFKIQNLAVIAALNVL